MIYGGETIIAREIRLASRPVGEPHEDNFELVRTELPQLRNGQILVRNTWMSVDPYMRGRMNDIPSYIPPLPARRGPGGRRCR